MLLHSGTGSACLKKLYCVTTFEAPPENRNDTACERRDMGRALEAETGPKMGPYCIGDGRALGPRYLCYVMLRRWTGCGWVGLAEEGPSGPSRGARALLSSRGLAGFPRVPAAAYRPFGQ